MVRYLLTLLVLGCVGALGAILVSGLLSLIGNPFGVPANVIVPVTAGVIAAMFSRYLVTRGY